MKLFKQQLMQINILHLKILYRIFEESYYRRTRNGFLTTSIQFMLHSRNRHVPITPGTSHPLIYNTRESGIKVMIPQNIFQLTHSHTTRINCGFGGQFSIHISILPTLLCSRAFTGFENITN